MTKPDGISRFEHEWRTSVTAISAAAEILRDHGQLATFEHDRFVQAILDESRKLTHTFENIAKFC